MLAGADLVVDAKGVEVGLGAQVQHAKMARGDQPHQMVEGVIGGNHASGRPVALPESADDCACRVAGSERAGFGIEAVARGGEAGPSPLRWRGRVGAPKCSAGLDASTSQADGTSRW
jgi:hypothetical protein